MRASGKLGKGSPERGSKLKTPDSSLAPTNLSLTSEHEKDEDVELSGLTDTRYCTTPKNLATVLGSMVGDTLQYPNDEKRDLVQQFGVYFSALGWKTEDFMTASAGTSLPKPDDLVTDVSSVGMISPAVRLTLQNIAQFTATVRRRKLFLAKSTTFDELHDYHASNRATHLRKYDAAALGLGRKQSSSGGDHKVPAFTVPKFVGDSLEGQAFVDNVVRKFKGHGQLSFLEDDQYCDDHSVWSEAFSSCLLDSLADSDILGYLSTELKDEGNCAEVWDKITSCLQTSDLTMARIMQHWSDFFALRCTSMDDFPLFYSGVKKVTHKLREANSIAVTDDTFLKAFLSGSISCEELKTEAKGFLLEGSAQYDTILDKIHSDYRAQTSGEQMRVGNSSSTAQLRRGKQSDAASKGRSGRNTPPPAHGHTKLPPNTGNLIPNAYYQQFKGWYEASRVPEKDRSDEQNKFLSSFKWKHTVDPKAKRPWNPPTRPRDDQRRKYDDRHSRRARGRDKRRRSPSSDSYSDDSAPSRRHRSRRGCARRSQSPSPSRCRSRSPVGRRGPGDEGQRDGQNRSRRASLFKRT